MWRVLEVSRAGSWRATGMVESKLRTAMIQTTMRPAKRFLWAHQTLTASLVLVKTKIQWLQCQYSSASYVSNSLDTSHYPYNLGIPELIMDRKISNQSTTLSSPYTQHSTNIYPLLWSKSTLTLRLNEAGLWKTLSGPITYCLGRLVISVTGSRVQSAVKMVPVCCSEPSTAPHSG